MSKRLVARGAALSLRLAEASVSRYLADTLGVRPKQRRERPREPLLLAQGKQAPRPAYREGGESPDASRCLWVDMEQV